MSDNTNNSFPTFDESSASCDNEYLKILISAFTINTEVDPDKLQRNARCLKDIWNANYHKSTDGIIIPNGCYETLIEVFIENSLLLTTLMDAIDSNSAASDEENT